MFDRALAVNFRGMSDEKKQAILSAMETLATMVRASGGEALFTKTLSPAEFDDHK